MADCPYCVRYTAGPRRGEVFMRCLMHTVSALGGDSSSLRAAAILTQFFSGVKRDG